MALSGFLFLGLLLVSILFGLLLVRIFFALLWAILMPTTSYEARTISDLVND
jgi:hypothetical protein